jgi:uncharacterized phage protein (TIGR02216 family)
VFWSLSLAEWRALLTPRGYAALDRAGLEILMQAYPDAQ